MSAPEIVILADPLPRPRAVFDKAELERKHVGLRITRDLDAGIALATELLALRKTPLVVPIPPAT